MFFILKEYIIYIYINFRSFKVKKIVFLLFILVSLSIFAKDNQIIAAGGLTWFTSYTSALEDAKERESIIIVNFTGSDWCEWCHKLEADVFDKDVFHKWAEKNATLLYLDFPQKKELSEQQVNHNQVLAQVYGVQGFPTILILDDKGRLIGRSGYGDNVDIWIKNIEDNMVLFKSYVDTL